jgi:hypothetical protein
MLEAPLYGFSKPSNRFANFQALSAATAQQENLPRVANRCATEFSRRPVHCGAQGCVSHGDDEP